MTTDSELLELLEERAREFAAEDAQAIDYARDCRRGGPDMMNDGIDPDEHFEAYKPHFMDKAKAYILEELKK